jgi:ethanolamine utilization protein EutN
MLLARVIGNATSTVKHPSLEGWRMLVVQPFHATTEEPDGGPVLAVDGLGAGFGQSVVLTSDGKATRKLLGSDQTPVRWSTIGIADDLEGMPG